MNFSDIIVGKEYILTHWKWIPSIKNIPVKAIEISDTQIELRFLYDSVKHRGGCYDSVYVDETVCNEEIFDLKEREEHIQNIEKDYVL